MPRHGTTWLGIVALLLLAGSRLIADPPAPASNSLEKTLAVQKAMVMARSYLRAEDPKRAVDLLEQGLPMANGNSAYLELLRDSYRAYIMELGLKNQGQAAQAYVQRLVILDPSALDAPIHKADPVILPKTPRDTNNGMPKYDPRIHAKSTSPAKIEEVKARGRMAQPEDDPFDAANRRVPSAPASLDPVKAAALLAKADEEFDRGRFTQALQCYEQLVRQDEKVVDRVRERYAYSRFAYAADQLNTNPAVPLPELRKQVASAIEMAPRLAPTGNDLLKLIDERGQSVDADPPLDMQHFGKNPQGWQVTETVNFRIFHNQSRELVERVALISERTRLAMSRKWLGGAGDNWAPKCEIVLHSTAADYSRLTNVPASSPGHSRIETDPTTFKVTGRRIDLHVDTLGMLEAVLPHETTHVVLAGNFGAHQVPRWADEGVAVLTEPLEKIEQHRRNLSKCQKDGQLMPVRDLMSLQNYPQAKQITAFYAQSVMLVEYLTQQRGPRVFTEFLREGLQGSYETSLRKHYGLTFAQLQTNWDQHVGGGRLTAAAGR